MGRRGPPPDPARIAAIAAGAKRFFPSMGEPCKNDHRAERLVSNGGCCECLRLAHPWQGKLARRDIVVA
jgi:hypothetical protein